MHHGLYPSPFASVLRKTCGQSLAPSSKPTRLPPRSQEPNRLPPAGPKRMTVNLTTLAKTSCGNSRPRCCEPSRSKVSHPPLRSYSHTPASAWPTSSAPSTSTSTSTFSAATLHSQLTPCTARLEAAITRVALATRLHEVAHRWRAEKNKEARKDFFREVGLLLG